jgi:cell division protein FtsI/penicillin-binding protein 2
MERRVLTIRIFFAGILLTVFFGLLTMRLLFVQLVRSNELKSIGAQSYIKKRIVEFERGTIFDRRGRGLAVSAEVFSVYANPRKVKHQVHVSSKIASILDMDQDLIFKKLKRQDTSFVWIRRKISPAKAEAIRKLGFSGVGLIREYKRFYPKGELGGQLIGFVGMDNVGLEGVELSFDHYLRGPKRSVEVLRDAVGREIDSEDLLSPKKGCDIYLTVDEVIQHITEEELRRTCLKFHAKRALCVVMNPQTGEILASSVFPSFDPGDFQCFDVSFWKNRVITDAFEPGSTFKVITFCCAIEKGSFIPDEEFLCKGAIEISAHKVIRCPKVHKRLSSMEVLAHSCNVATIQIARRVSPKSFYKFIKSFGFGSETGIDLVGEGEGLLKKYEDWDNTSPLYISIGQEIGVTPIQLAAAVSAIANGGRLMRPYVVKGIRFPNGKVKEFSPHFVRRVISKETSRKMIECLEIVVREGTGQEAAVPSFRVCGKTGTAQKIDPKTGEYNAIVSSFIGFLPAEDPQILILVIVDEPQGSYWGGLVAGPCFREIARKTVAYLGLLPIPLSRQPMIAAHNSGQVGRGEDDRIGTHNSYSDYLKMPNLCGLSMREVLQRVSSLNVKYRFLGSGGAFRQYPLPGVEVTPETLVRVWFQTPNYPMGER